MLIVILIVIIIILLIVYFYIHYTNNNEQMTNVTQTIADIARQNYNTKDKELASAYIDEIYTYIRTIGLSNSNITQSSMYPFASCDVIKRLPSIVANDDIGDNLKAMLKIDRVINTMKYINKVLLIEYLMCNTCVLKLIKIFNNDMSFNLNNMCNLDIVMNDTPTNNEMYYIKINKDYANLAKKIMFEFTRPSVYAEKSLYSIFCIKPELYGFVPADFDLANTNGFVYNFVRVIYNVSGTLNIPSGNVKNDYSDCFYNEILESRSSVYVLKEQEKINRIFAKLKNEQNATVKSIYDYFSSAPVFRTVKGINVNSNVTLSFGLMVNGTYTTCLTHNNTLTDTYFGEYANIYIYALSNVTNASRTNNAPKTSYKDIVDEIDALKNTNRLSALYTNRAFGASVNNIDTPEKIQRINVWKESIDNITKKINSTRRILDLITQYNVLKSAYENINNPTPTNTSNTSTTQTPQTPIQPSIPVQQPSVPVQQPSIPVQQPSVPVQQPSIPVQQPSVPVRQPSVPVRQPSVPVQQPSIPVQQPSIPVLPQQPITQPQTTIPQYTQIDENTQIYNSHPSRATYISPSQNIPNQHMIYFNSRNDNENIINNRCKIIYNSITTLSNIGVLTTDEKRKFWNNVEPVCGYNTPMR